MTKLKKGKYNTVFLLLVSIAWFIVMSYITAYTEYYKLVASQIVGLQGSALQKNLLEILIVLISLMPSGVFLAYPYIKKNFKDHVTFRVIFLSFGIAMALYMPLCWYSFLIDFSK